MRRWFEKTIFAIWFSKGASSFLNVLLGLSLRLLGLFTRALIEKKSTRQAQAKQHASSSAKPLVAVIGNLIVGGAGKTPLVTAIGLALASRGLRVGYIASGYGSPAYDAPRIIKHTESASSVGDEPALILKKTGGPIAVGKDRAKALAILSAAHQLDIVLSDDGLQHEALRRDIEMVVFDERFAGNELLLPAGPLREPLTRLKSVDFVFAPALIFSKIQANAELNAVRLNTSIWRLEGFCALKDYAKSAAPRLLEAQVFSRELCGQTLEAIVGMANPKKFLDTLKQHGMQANLHRVGDHAGVDLALLNTLREQPVVMTEKDAVKYQELLESPGIDLSNCWVAVGHAEVNTACLDAIYQQVMLTR